MVIISLIIIIFLIFGFLLGFKRGFTYQLVKMTGIVLVLILSFLFKDSLGLWLFEKFPIIDLGEGLNSINILIYQSIAFILIFFLLSIVLRLLLVLTKNFERLLKATIILGIPSKILGGILGFLEHYIYAFLILTILNLPMFNLNLKTSGVANFILNETPIISSKVDVKVIEEVKEVIDSDSDKKNEEIIDILIKNKIINEDDVYKYIKLGKIESVEV